MSKKILFLGGSPLVVNAIRWAKEIGYVVAVTDRNPDAEGLKLADISLNIDSEDIKGILLWALKEKPSYCYSGNDFAMVTSSVVHNALGIPGIPINVAAFDKIMSKKLWHQCVNTPGYSHVLPVVIKPSNKSGSIGVTIVYDGDILEAIEYASKYGDVIIEEFIEGSHYDVNGFFDLSGFHRMGIAERYFLGSDYPVPWYGKFPAQLEPEVKREIYVGLREAAMHMGIRHGTVKADVVVKNNKPYFLEISPCFHGDIVTICMMGFLKERNPVYQVFKNIYHGTSIWENVDDTDMVGFWRLMSSKNDIAEDGHYYRGGKAHPRNNNEIIGLTWWHERK